MLSVRGEGDEEKSAGLGLGYRGGRRMEENELEEGEAVSSLEYDSVVDPDVSLSYIDEKIQEVLGHFQKVFEGEISAESSGAKLGEYGSFLPVYLRLPPVWHQQTQNKVPARPLSQTLPPENRTASTSPPFPPGNNPAPEAQQSDDAKRINEENSGTNKIISKENGNNLLKVRIKVGSGNVLLRPLADIYSDMGLDYSPSSSPEGSPCSSGGISLGTSPLDSPRAVFQVMTRFPIPEARLLSPLPERCLHLTESEASAVSKGKLSVKKKGKNFKDIVRPNSEIEIHGGNITKSYASVTRDEPKKEKSSLLDHVDEELLEFVASSDARKTIDAGFPALDLKGKKLEEEKSNKQRPSQHRHRIKKISDKNLNGEAEKIASPAAAETLLPSRDSTLHEERKTNLRDPGAKYLTKSVESLTFSAENKKKPHLQGEHTSKKHNAVRSLEELSKNPVRERKAGDEMKANEKIPPEFSDKSNDYLNRKKSEFFVPSNVSKKEKESCPVMANNASSLDAAMPPLGHVVIEDNWVCCDKCQQWRLLPYGMDPAQLPKKWLCSMLYWLPGMNKCSISEEETTRALHAAYQAPLAESQIPLNDHLYSQTASGGLLVNGHDFDHGQSQVEFHNSLKKNNSGKEYPYHGGQAMMESMSQANGLNKHYSEPRDKAPDMNFEKVKEKKKKREKTVERLVAEGGVIERKGHIHKSKSKRGSDQDAPRVSKKLKSEKAHRADEDWNSIDEKSTAKKTICLLSNTINAPSSKVGKTASYDREELKKKFKLDEKVSSNGDPIENSIKKRKEKEEMRSGPSKEKRVKIPKLDDEIAERDQAMKCPHKMMDNITKRSIIDAEQKNLSHGFVDSNNQMNYLESKRAHSDIQPCTEANSSSSKVSSSSKNKSHFHEVSGSPVESVSSSPLKISSARGYDAFISQKRGSHENPNAGKSSSPTRNGSSSSKVKSKDRKLPQLSSGKEKDEYKENKNISSNAINKAKASTGSQLRAKEKLKSSNSGVEKSKDKISNSVKNSRHDSETETRGGSYRTSEKKGPQGPSDSKPKNLQVPESLESHSSKTKKTLQSEYPPSSLEDKRLEKNSVENDVALVEEKGKMREQPKNATAQHGRNQNYSAGIVLKEARDLKHTANRLKAEGKEQQSTALYFEAALKFLHVAFLLELSGTDVGKQAESAQSLSMYSDTAKLCEFCAHEYERLRDMAAAALVYKCMEVAYMKVVYSKHSNASKDRHELQNALHISSSGDSPSSSASDIDNLNHQSTINKTSTAKVANPPQSIGSLVIAPRYRPTYIRLLDFTQDINFAMEASRRSQNAFSGASSSQEESKYSPEGLASVRRVLDLSFHDVEGLLRLVRQSMDSIIH